MSNKFYDKDGNLLNNEEHKLTERYYMNTFDLCKEKTIEGGFISAAQNLSDDNAVIINPEPIDKPKKYIM